MARDRISAAFHSIHGTSFPSSPAAAAAADTTPASSAALADSLLTQCQTLISELSALQSHLSAIGKPNAVELRQFKGVVASELKSLEKLREQASAYDSSSSSRSRSSGSAQVAEEVNGRAEEEEEEKEGGDAGEEEDEEEEPQMDERESRLLHSLRSSNLQFYATVWRVAKMECRGLVAFSKRFYWHETRGGRISAIEQTKMKDGASSSSVSPPLPTSAKDGEADWDRLESEFGDLAVSKKTGKSVKRSVLVDIVADDGEEWVKVSTITPNRLLFELAKLGWEAPWDSAHSDEEKDESWNVTLQNDGSDDEDDNIELIKLAIDMKKAASLIRVRYKHPRIRFVLPKVVEGQIPEIDNIINGIRKAGAIVECGTIATQNGSLDVDGTNDDASSQGLERFLPALLPNALPSLTSKLNVDCTLLLAMVSDLSHIRNIPPAPHHHRAILRQIEVEAKQPLIPTEIWPTMGDKDLVCTEEAVMRMREIVDTIGTPTEKERTSILMGDKEQNRKVLVSQYQKLSDYQVPADWKLPIKVVPVQDEIERGLKDGRLPGVASKIANEISDINKSVFFYGWVTGVTTISSNRMVAKQIETLIEDNRFGDDDLAGPPVWLCDTARSLVGKENKRR
ncbi:hypothetical protein AJ80_03920 [Polytolypa hystricis UAMH7299]|uniref:DUF1308 domain-containing protein n=1 Tax=Polytolypa hystricis (strain UAMH7299) TaxID=1447883 RepID=A0A2B7YE04_POLH7|nr:hypothetical protein AJ80_03920 [Polytolypa hystricis UAMH7299]